MNVFKPVLKLGASLIPGGTQVFNAVDKILWYNL